jgi:hypothetical protein
MNNQQFAVGQQVRCIRPYRNMEKGAIYTIGKVYTSEEAKEVGGDGHFPLYVRLETDPETDEFFGKPLMHNAARFVPADAPETESEGPFKVGQKVKCIDAQGRTILVEGKLYTVSYTEVPDADHKDAAFQMDGKELKQYISFEEEEVCPGLGRKRLYSNYRFAPVDGEAATSTTAQGTTTDSRQKFEADGAESADTAFDESIHPRRCAIIQEQIDIGEKAAGGRTLTPSELTAISPAVFTAWEKENEAPKGWTAEKLTAYLGTLQTQAEELNAQIEALMKRIAA